MVIWRLGESVSSCRSPTDQPAHFTNGFVSRGRDDLVAGGVLPEAWRIGEDMPFTNSPTRHVTNYFLRNSLRMASRASMISSRVARLFAKLSFSWNALSVGR